MKLAVRIKYFCVKSKKYFNHSHFKTNTALRNKFRTHYIFTKILRFSYNNALIHPNVTVQYLKSIPIGQKAWKTCVHTSVSGKNQSSSQTKGFKHGLVQKILGTCERVANIFLHPDANYTYMYNLHTVCKSAHVNGALVKGILSIISTIYDLLFTVELYRNMLADMPHNLEWFKPFPIVCLHMWPC